MANQDLTEAVRLSPKYAEAYLTRGTDYAEKGDYDRAIGDFNEVIQLNPKSDLAYYSRGRAIVTKKTPTKRSPTSQRPSGLMGNAG